MSLKKQKHILIKINEDVIDLKETIETDNSKENLKSNLNELLINLCNHIGEFGTKMIVSSIGGLNKRKEISSTFISSKKIKGSVYDVIHVDKNELNPFIPLVFKDFSCVIKFQMKLFGNKKFVRYMFSQMDQLNKKRLQRFNLVIKYFNDNVEKFVRTKAMIDYSKVFNNQKNGLIINRFLNHIKLIK